MAQELDQKEIKEIIQSGHLNFLIGSGCSRNYLSVLGDIEEKMNKEVDKEPAQKEYYKLIRKSKAVLNTSLENDDEEKKELKKTKEIYASFFSFWSEVISKRSLHLVSKQVNVFTTNFDLFMEDACERLSIPYNDGFSGRIKPTFSVSNFNKIQKYKSLQFDNTSDIPLFNIIKLHGSISWRNNGDQDITYSDGSHIPDDLDKKTGKKFSDGYKKIAVINPNAEKHFETVLDINYASMLRKFVLELEKENSVLMVFGFSMADRHIKDLLYSAMKSNPTLIVLYFSYDKYDGENDNLKKRENLNLHVISPKPDFSFNDSIAHLLEIFTKKDDGEYKKNFIKSEYKKMRGSNGEDK